MRLLLAVLVSLWLVAPTAVLAESKPEENPGLPLRVVQREAQVAALTAALEEAQAVLQYIRVDRERHLLANGEAFAQ